MANSFDGTFCANSERLLTFIFAKYFIIDVWQDFIIYTSVRGAMELYSLSKFESWKGIMFQWRNDEVLKYDFLNPKSEFRQLERLIIYQNFQSVYRWNN